MVAVEQIEEAANIAANINYGISKALYASLIQREQSEERKSRGATKYRNETLRIQINWHAIYYNLSNVWCNMR